MKRDGSPCRVVMIRCDPPIPNRYSDTMSILGIIDDEILPRFGRIHNYNKRRRKDIHPIDAVPCGPIHRAGVVITMTITITTTRRIARICHPAKAVIIRPVTIHDKSLSRDPPPPPWGLPRTPCPCIHNNSNNEGSVLSANTATSWIRTCHRTKECTRYTRIIVPNVTARPTNDPPRVWWVLPIRVVSFAVRAVNEAFRREMMTAVRGDRIGKSPLPGVMVEIGRIAVGTMTTDEDHLRQHHHHHHRRRFEGKACTRTDASPRLPCHGIDVIFVRPSPIRDSTGPVLCPPRRTGRCCSRRATRPWRIYPVRWDRGPAAAAATTVNHNRNNHPRRHRLPCHRMKGCPGRRRHHRRRDNNNNNNSVVRVWPRVVAAPWRIKGMSFRDRRTRGSMGAEIKPCRAFPNPLHEVVVVVEEK